MDKIALNAMDRHGVMTDIPKGIRDLRTNPNSYLPLQQGKKPSLRDITLRAYNKMPLQSRLDSKDIQRYIEPLKSGKADFNKLGKTASADYEEMVKTAYEDIIGGIEKEASTALDRHVLRGGLQHDPYIRDNVLNKINIGQQRAQKRGVIRGASGELMPLTDAMSQAKMSAHVAKLSTEGKQGSSLLHIKRSAKNKVADNIGMRKGLSAAIDFKNKAHLFQGV